MMAASAGTKSAEAAAMKLIRSKRFTLAALEQFATLKYSTAYHQVVAPRKPLTVV